MGLRIGKVAGQTTGTYKGVDNVRTLQVELFGDNPETVIDFNQGGEDSAPVNGDLVIIREIGSDKYAASIKDSLALVSVSGEREFYSRDDSNKFARLKLKLDGSVGIKNEKESLDFLTVFTAYNTAIKNIVTSDSATINAASQTALDNALADVLKVISGI